jgi:hypothetical protein
MTEVEALVIRDLSSGRYHRAFREGDNLATFEGDNLDQAGEYEIVPEVPEGVEYHLLCQRCYPPAETS